MNLPWLRFPELPGWIQISWLLWFGLGLVLTAYSWNLLAQRPPAGTIDTPTPNSVVTPSFSVAGTITDLPKGSTLWVAIRKGDLIWPKEPKVIAATTKWVYTVTEGSTPSGGRFSVLLLATTPAATSTLERWFKGPSFPGIAVGATPGLTILAEAPFSMQ